MVNANKKPTVLIECDQLLQIVTGLLQSRSLQSRSLYNNFLLQLTMQQDLGSGNKNVVIPQGWYIWLLHWTEACLNESCLKYRPTCKMYWSVVEPKVSSSRPTWKMERSLLKKLCLLSNYLTSLGKCIFEFFLCYTYWSIINKGLYSLPPCCQCKLPWSIGYPASGQKHRQHLDNCLVFSWKMKSISNW